MIIAPDAVTPDAMADLYRRMVSRGVELRLAPSGRLQMRDVEGRIVPEERDLLRANSRFMAEWLLNHLAPLDASPDPTVTRCDGCGYSRFRDVPIHEGRSLRRDCARCGRTMGCPRWYGVDNAELPPAEPRAP